MKRRKKKMKNDEQTKESIYIIVTDKKHKFRKIYVISENNEPLKIDDNLSNSEFFMFTKKQFGKIIENGLRGYMQPITGIINNGPIELPNGDIGYIKDPSIKLCSDKEDATRTSGFNGKSIIMNDFLKKGRQ